MSRCLNRILRRNNRLNVSVSKPYLRNLGCGGGKTQSNEADDKTTCWKCGGMVCKCCMFCDAPTCKAIQPVDGKECNYFNLFGIDENFKVDERKLEFEFKNLQKQLHPDKHGMKCLQERQASQQASSVVNQAYQVLKSPVDRAAYLLSSRNIDILDEGKTYSDPKLMMEIFELREEAEALDSDEEVETMMRSLDTEVHDVSNKVQTYIEGDDYAEAAKQAVRLKYLWKLLEDLRERRDHA